MFNLIKNEIYKIVKKKSTIIFILVMFLYSGLITYMYTRDNLRINNSKTQTINVDNDFDSKINSLDKNSISYYNDLTNILVEQKIYQLSSKYKESWQQELITNKYSNKVHQYYINKYDVKNKKLESELENDLKLLDNILENNLIFNYVELKIKDLEEKLNLIEETDKNKNEIKYIKEEILLHKYRLDNKIKYDGSFLDNALTDQINTYHQLNYYYSLDKLSESDKNEKKIAEANLLINNFILENEMDLNSNKSLRGILMGFGDNYILFLFMFVIMISGSIFSNEFSKGTIKNLLITPYSRTKILLSKFITMILTLPIITIILLIFNIILGSIIFGYTSLNIPILHFNYTTNVLIQYNVFGYLGLMLLGTLPQLLILMTLSFLFSIIYPSSSLSITLSFIVLIVSNIINSLAITFNVKFLKYFITLSWDFGEYIFGKNPFGTYFEYTSLSFSIFICLVYFIGMFGFSIYLFKHKNIKNS